MGYVALTFYLKKNRHPEVSQEGLALVTLQVLPEAAGAKTE